MSEHASTTRLPEPDDVFLLTEHLLVKEREHSRSNQHPEHNEVGTHQPVSKVAFEVGRRTGTIGGSDERSTTPIASPLSDVVGHLVYGRVISEDDATHVNSGFAAYLRILAGTEHNAYDRDVGGDTVSRIYFFGKVLGSTSMTSPALSLSAALRFPTEDWRKAVDDAWALIPEAYKSSPAFKGPDIMLLVTNMKAAA